MERGVCITKWRQERWDRRFPKDHLEGKKDIQEGNNRRTLKIWLSPMDTSTGTRKKKLQLEQLEISKIFIIPFLCLLILLFFAISSITICNNNKENVLAHHAHNELTWILSPTLLLIHYMSYAKITSSLWVLMPIL